MKQIEIRETTVAEVVSLSQQLPEFSNPYREEVYAKRMNNVPQLILGAFDEGEIVGFKVGYEKESDGSFYSWMGGILPDYRRMGIARRLAETQEAWAKEKGYHSIRFKTRNRLKAMLTFALWRGFYIIDFLPSDTIEEHRILLEKKL